MPEEYRGVHIQIRGRDLPGRDCCDHAAVVVGVQRGREVVDLRSADADEIVWAFDATDVTARDGAPDVRGPFVHGRPGGRFLYLSWGSVAPGGHPEMFRRAKLMLDPALLAAAAGATLVGEVGLTMANGTPLCAAVRPPVITWTVRPDPL
ncbi:DUF5990 family protein [Pseudonocardia charpentierae]|uniref:DUF5990 family protein n=1 Tax=Pseudonocardia charpentierae TaxID=3075545 RepID=A0ABU2N4C3_9PSEU|nr:DUF5990 family protein [Pseudonocardia sp. DSM 45834]MDT0348755.1 DUF5990 family protein [Pseudonocardia sp. DSM 45834]